jgi:hypothetical protein
MPFIVPPYHAAPDNAIIWHTRQGHCQIRPWFRRLILDAFQKVFITLQPPKLTTAGIGWDNYHLPVVGGAW